MKIFHTPSLLTVLTLAIPTGSSLAGTTDFTVQYQNYNAASPSDGIIEAGLQLRNNTSVAQPLSGVVLRYWFTKNGATTVSPACWWWKAADCAGLTVTSGAVSATGADQYVEVRFPSSAGSLAAGATTVPVDLGVTFGGVNVTETDDYSYGDITAFTHWSKVTVHDAGSAPLSGLRGGTPPTASGGGTTVSAELFDDFNYSGPGDAEFLNRWTVRTYAGAPGVAGAQWLASNVTLENDGTSSNRLMRLRASTNGTAAGTSHVEVLSKAQKFRYGTYATRFRFANTPMAGPRLLADKPVETFFTITPYTDPNYSEQDFEYLPNGGWGQGTTSTLFLTSWDRNKTPSAERKISASHDGWRTLVLHASSAGVVYFIDGVQWAAHGSQFAPTINQFLDFQLWFIELDGSGNRESRTYFEQADWVYFAKDALLSPNDVAAKVAGFRAAAITRKDTVP